MTSRETSQTAIRLRALPGVVHRMMRHPASSPSRIGFIKILWRFGAWQVQKRLDPRPRVCTVFGDARLVCHPDNAASNAVLYFDQPDWPEMGLLRLALRPGDTFLDVGANVGVYSVLAWSRVKPTGRVIAIEAEPAVRSRLTENFRINGMNPKDILAVAVGEKDGMVPFTVGRDCLGRIATESERDTLPVPVRRLDGLVGSDSANVVIGKIDIEGMELPALRGGAELLRRGTPKCWIVETNGLENRSELSAFLAEHGFLLFEAAGDGSILRHVPPNGPFPMNSIAVGDMDWLRARVPTLRIVASK